MLLTKKVGSEKTLDIPLFFGELFQISFMSYLVKFHVFYSFSDHFFASEILFKVICFYVYEECMRSGKYGKVREK